MIDLIIKNAFIVDGTGNKGYKGDVAITEGKIVGTGNLEDKYSQAKRVDDACGMVLSPGFIDVHGHTDMFIFDDPGCGAKLKQGITTEICGQCGFTLFPVSDEHWEAYKSYYEKMGSKIYESYREFTTADAYLTRVDKLDTGINLGLFVGQGAIRMAAMGLSAQKPNSVQLEKMKELTEEAMDSGAFGLSSGLMYAPGSFSNQEEIEELCKKVGEQDGMYSSHLRNQGDRLVECVEKTILIGAKTGTPVNISHHKAVGKSNWGKVKHTCAMIDAANEMGIKVTHDVYPYAASSTTLTATLPPSCMEDETEQLIENLRNKDYKQELKDRIFDPQEEWDNDIKGSGYESLLIVRARNTQEAVGKTISEYAAIQGKKEFDTYVDLLIDNNLDISDVCFSMDEKDVDYLIDHDKCMFATDSLYEESMDMAHPRSIGTFPRILGEYVRKRRKLSLEKAIHKMTGYPAHVYGIKSKGKIQIGYDADLVLFDEKTIIDQSYYFDPIKDNEGIKYVMVNGKIAVEDNELKDISAGRVIRKNEVSAEE